MPVICGPKQKENEMNRKAAFVMGLFLIIADPEAFADGGNMVGVETRPFQVFWEQFPSCR